jgi:guanylate kinase
MDEEPGDRGRLVILSGPSGSGKSTVVTSLLKHCPLPLALSISATTRAARPGEQDGREYYFMTPERFERLRQENRFLECADVFGNWYGTLRSEVDDRRRRGQWVVLEIDVQGALSVMEQEPQAISIFLKTPSAEEYERRLRGRKTEDEATIAKRLDGARRELALAERYRFQVINDRVERAVEEICNILKQQEGNTRA